MKTKIGDIKSIKDLFIDELYIGNVRSRNGIAIETYTWKCLICGDTVRGRNNNETFTKHIEFHRLLDKLKLIEYDTP